MSRLLIGDILTKTPEPSKLLRGIALLCKLSSLWHELRRPMKIACNNYMKGKVRCPSLLTSGTYPKRHRLSPDQEPMLGSWKLRDQPAVKYGKKKHTLHSDSSYTLILVLPSPKICRIQVKCASRTILTHGDRNVPYTCISKFTQLDK